MSEGISAGSVRILQRGMVPSPTLHNVPAEKRVGPDGVAADNGEDIFSCGEADNSRRGELCSYFCQVQEKAKTVQTNKVSYAVEL